MKLITMFIVVLVPGLLVAQQPAQIPPKPCLGTSTGCGAGPITFGSALDTDQQIQESQRLANTLSSSGNPQWRAKGDQHRTYHFPAANADMPYRLYVPMTWDGQSKLPLIVMLHGGGSNENRYMDSNGKQMQLLAEQHGYVVVIPLGYSPLGAFGTPLKLPAVFGQAEAAAKQRPGDC